MGRHSYAIEMREKHIARKKRICKLIYHVDWYDNDNQYSKNKIHCSLGKVKTNINNQKSKGPIDQIRGFCRLALTNDRYGKKNYKPSDRKKVDSMNYQLYEYTYNM